MRKYIYIPIVIFLGVLIASCSDTTTNPPPVTETGSILIDSSPQGAQIILDGTNTGKFTPDSVNNIDAGSHSVTISLNGYRDTTISVTVVANQLVSKFVNLTTTLSLSTYGPVRIWETAGTGTNQPSGLDLSTGNAYAVTGTDKDKVDLYYSTDGQSGNTYLVQSADLYPNLTRSTMFYVSNSTNLDDTLDSPNSAFQQGWTNYMDDAETHYAFLYDADGHYSKIIITGSGTVNNIAWVEVKWIYNNTGADRRF